MSWISTILGIEAPEVWTKNLKITLQNNDFSSLNLAIVLQPIFDGLKKIEFYSAPGYENSESIIKIVDFLNNNYNNSCELLSNFCIFDF